MATPKKNLDAGHIVDVSRSGGGMNAGMYSSATDKWNTPADLVDKLATVFDWDCDVCSSGTNVCDFYYDQEQDGLAQNWLGLCWMNPPYGREIGAWMAKAASSGTTVVCLVPARTDTRWWHDNVPQASLVVFIRGRLKFGGAKNSAPFPSAFVVFGSITDEQAIVLSSFGWAVKA